MNRIATQEAVKLRFRITSRGVQVDLECAFPVHEGVEDRVLSGMQRILRANPRIEIVVETTAGSGTDRRLQADGYTVAALDEYATGYGNFVYRHGQTG